MTEPITPKNDDSDTVTEAVNEALMNALNVQVKENYGEDFFINSTIVVVLVERPREPLDKPGTPRFALMVKTTGPVHESVAVNMLREAAVKFQASGAQRGGPRAE